MGSQPIILHCTYSGTVELIETYLPVTVLSLAEDGGCSYPSRPLQVIAISRLSSLSRDCRCGLVVEHKPSYV